MSERDQAASLALEGHEIERLYGWSKAEEADHPKTPRYACECGMPLAMTKRRAVGVHKAHMLLQGETR